MILSNLIETLLILTKLLQVVSPSGTLHIRLIHYHNPHGKGENGNCCETFFPIGCGVNKCDPMFTVCADVLPRSVAGCSLVNRISGSLQGTNDVTFTDNIAGMPNPLSTTFVNIKKGVYIQIAVDDDDNGQDDHIGKVETSFQKLKPDEVQKLNMQSKQFSLQIEVSITCDLNWSGEGCSMFNYCSNFTCLHGGKCITGPLQASCQCSPKYTGENCETRLPHTTSTQTTFGFHTRVDVSKIHSIQTTQKQGRSSQHENVATTDLKIISPSTAATKTQGVTEERSTSAPGISTNASSRHNTWTSLPMSSSVVINLISTTKLAALSKGTPHLHITNGTGLPHTLSTRSIKIPSSTAMPDASSTVLLRTSRSDRLTSPSESLGRSVTTRHPRRSSTFSPAKSVTSPTTRNKVSTTGRKTKTPQPTNSEYLTAQTNYQTTPLQGTSFKEINVTSMMSATTLERSSKGTVKQVITTLQPIETSSKGTLLVSGFLTDGQKKSICNNLKQMALSALGIPSISNDVQVTLDSQTVYGDNGELVTEVTYTLTFENVTQDPHLAIDAIHRKTKPDLEKIMGVKFYEGKVYAHFDVTTLQANQEDKHGKKTSQIAIGVGVGCAVLVIIIALILLYRKRRHSDSYYKMGYFDESVEESQDQPAVFDNTLYLELRLECKISDIPTSKHNTEI